MTKKKFAEMELGIETPNSDARGRANDPVNGDVWLLCVVWVLVVGRGKVSGRKVGGRGAGTSRLISCRRFQTRHPDNRLVLLMS